MAVGDDPVTRKGEREALGTWTSILLVSYDARTEYPEGYVAQIRGRFPSPLIVKEGFLPEPSRLSQLADLANQAMLTGSLAEVLVLRAEFAKVWKESRATTPNTGRYCIGGAFMAFTSFPGATRFPRPESLGRALRRANPRLVPPEADALARDMLAANDLGDFELAWTTLEKALAQGRRRSVGRIETVYASRVAGLDVFVSHDTLTALADGEVVARRSLPGLSDFLATTHTSLELGRNATGRPDRIRVASPGDPGIGYTVPLESPDRVEGGEGPGA